MMNNLAAASIVLSPFLIDISHFLVIKKTAPRSLFLGILFSAMLGSINYLQSPASYLLQILFFIATLCISIGTDFSYFLISRYVTLYLIPLVWIGAYLHFMPISLYESIEGAVLSFIFLGSIKYLFLLVRKYEGLGQGDIDMLAYIGAFTGIIGAWCSLLYACIICLIYAFMQSLFTKSYNNQIPLGVFLGIGAWIHILYPDLYLSLIFTT